MILFVNSCVREASRTELLARHLLSRFKDTVEELRLMDITFPRADEEFLKTRDIFIAERNYSDPMFALARQFAAADMVVIAAPFWDLSFPAVLKQYLEQISVTGLTFFYTEEGIPQGLCRARKLYYVTTAGGTIFNEEFGYGYIKALAEGLFGIPETVMVKAEGLDIVGADVEAILQQAKEKIDRQPC